MTICSALSPCFTPSAPDSALGLPSVPSVLSELSAISGSLPSCSCSPALETRPIQDFSSENLLVTASPFAFPDVSASYLREILYDAIETVLSEHEKYHDKNCFIRSAKKMPLDTLIGFIFYLQNPSQNIQIAEYCGFDPDTAYSNSTFSAARGRLSSDLFKDIFDMVNDRLHEEGIVCGVQNGPQILAIDGSNIPLETFNKEPVDLRKSGEETFRSAIYLNGMLDVDTMQYVDVELQRIGERHETKAAKTLIARQRQRDDRPVIYVMDRGYHHFDLEYRIDQQGDFYVIRMQEASFNKLYGRIYGEEEQIDAKVDRTLTWHHIKNCDQGKGLHMVQKDNFSFWDEDGRCPFSSQNTESSYKRRIFPIHHYQSS